MTLTEVPFCPAVAVPVAVSCVADANLVVRFCPPKVTTAPLTKFVPVTVIEKLPVGTDPGLTLLIAGTGFWTVNWLVAVNVLWEALVAVIESELGEGRPFGAV